MTAVEYLLNQIKSFGIDTSFLNKSFEQAKEMEKAATISKKEMVEISDQEIEEMLFHHSNEYAYGFKDAIKWYRKQLKKKQ